MGNYKSKLNQTKQVPQHPSLLKPDFFIKKNQKFMTVKISSSKQQHDTWVKKRAIFKQMIKNPRHLFWPIESYFQKLGLFGDSGHSVLTFPYCPITLKDEIMQRSKSGVSFTQKELWYLFYSLISLAQQAHRYNETLGDIRPLNILLSEKGQINVITKLSLPTESKNIQKTLTSSMPTFLSPEQISAIYSEPKKVVNTSTASQSFSIGLTLLMTSILRNGDELYLPPKTFQKDLLKQYIRQLDEQTTFDESFKLLIKGLCQINPSKRFTAEQIFDYLEQHKRSIYGLSDFKIGPLPQKMMKKLNHTKIKKPVSNENFIFSSRSQKDLFKSFENAKVNNLTDSIKEKQQMKPHYVSQKLIRKIKQALHQEEQKMGLTPGSLLLEGIKVQKLKELLKKQQKQKEIKLGIDSNKKSSQESKAIVVPKLQASTQNSKNDQFNQGSNNKRVRWESDSLIKKSETKNKPNNLSTSNQILEKISQLKQNANPNNLQTSISRKVQKRSSFPLALSTMNSIQFGSFNQSPQKQNLFVSQIIQEKDLQKLDNLSDSFCSVKNKI